MKIIFTSDLHLNLNSYGVKHPEYPDVPFRTIDCLNAFKWLVRKSIDDIKPDLIVISGDTFDNESPSIFVHSQFNQCLKELSDNKIQVVVLVGNHDICRKYYPLNPIKTLELPYVKIIDDPKIFTYKGKVNFLMFPYSLDVENGTVTIKEKFSKFIEEYNTKKELLKSDVPNIFCGHFGVNGAIMSQYNIIDSATSIKTNMGFVNSSTKDISLTDLDSIGCDFIFLGDYHQYQKLDTKTPSFYSGALERMDFGEINEDKGFIIMDVDTKKLFFEKNENCRPMYNLVGKFSDIEEQYSKIQTTTNRPIIKITFIGTSEDKYVFNTSIDVFCQKIIKELNPIHLFTDSKIISSPLKPGDIFDEDIIEDKLFSSSQSVSSITKADIMTISRDILSGLNEDSIAIKRAIELSEKYYKDLT